MRTTNYVLSLVMCLSVYNSACSRLVKTGSIVWDVDNLGNIGGNEILVLGSPAVIETEKGRALVFDGTDDAVIVEDNPLVGASHFTVEVIFRPDAGGNGEQRFLHMQETDDRRVLIETRLSGDNQWFLDTFIKSGSSERTLYAKDFLHAVGPWYHAALVYDGRQMRHYVNGSQELEGSVSFRPVRAGRTSIGCRLNRVFWFKGAIRKVRVSDRALSPAEFMPL